MVGLVISLFVCMWAGIYYEVKNAPEIDDEGNVGGKDKEL